MCFQATPNCLRPLDSFKTQSPHTHPEKEGGRREVSLREGGHSVWEKEVPWRTWSVQEAFIHLFIHILMRPAYSVQHVLVLGPQWESRSSPALVELTA